MAREWCLSSAYARPSDRFAAFVINAVNRCPECGNSQWHVGRISAECAVCDIPLPLAKHCRGNWRADDQDNPPRDEISGRSRALAAMLAADTANL